MTAIRILAWVVVAAMVAAIGYAFTTGSFGDEGSTIVGLAWGKVTLIDLYLGFAMFGAWVAFREKSIPRTAGWWIALAVLGNLTAGIYLAMAATRANSVDEVLLGSRRA